MSDARPSFFDYDVTKLFADFRFPPMNVEAMWAAQRRNIEALSQANQLAVEGVQAMARRQFEMTRQGVEEFSAMMRDMAQLVSPEERITKNTEYAKQMIEKGVNHTREIAMLASKTGTEAAEVLHKRASESLDEIRAAIAPNGK
jgi:phasin family protein